jgi:hypothetical protein
VLGRSAGIKEEGEPMSRLRLIDAVALDPVLPWQDNTRDQFAIDANAVLEALLAEYGVEAAVAAVERQGFRGHYRHVVERLHAEASARRTRRQALGGESDAEPDTAAEGGSTTAFRDV